MPGAVQDAARRRCSICLPLAAVATLALFCGAVHSASPGWPPCWRRIRLPAGRAPRPKYYGCLTTNKQTQIYTKWSNKITTTNKCLPTRTNFGVALNLGIEKLGRRELSMPQRSQVQHVSDYWNKHQRCAVLDKYYIKNKRNEHNMLTARNKHKLQLCVSDCTTDRSITRASACWSEAPRLPRRAPARLRSLRALNH